MSFELIPAIDLMDGQVVRLVQGDPDQATFYPDPPEQVAAQFARAGCRWIHVVNLDGAFDLADNANQQALAGITDQGASIQFGGGLRSQAAMRIALERGVDRLIIGTLALKEGDRFGELVRIFEPGRLAVAVDVRGGQLQVHGWTDGVDLALDDYLARLAHQQVKWIIYTDADRDGTGAGLAIKAAQRIQQAFDFNVIISGGVGALQDIRDARAAGLAGVIVGKALHDGVFTIEEALAC